MRIGLLGLFGIGNFGNDASLEAMLNFLRRVRPDAELICICGHPGNVERDFAIATVPLRLPPPSSTSFRIFDRILFKLPRALHMWMCSIRELRQFDALIIPGTGILDDFGERPQGVPLSLFCWCLAARCRGTRAAFVSIGAGPIHNRVSRWLMKSAARMASYRSYRDEVSRSFMVRIGADGPKAQVFPDIAFKLPVSKGSLRPPGEDQVLTIGVGVMGYYGWYGTSSQAQEIYSTYIDKITRFVVWLLDLGHRVRVIMGEDSDWPAVCDLMRRANSERPSLPNGRIVADTASSIHDVMAQIADADIVVATRYHNVVCALMLGKPTISIGYAKKNDALLAEMKLREFCQHIEQLDVDLLVDQFTRLLSDQARHESNIRQANMVFQERLREQDALLVSRLLS
jgi:polysaccharide pyruvyl transferase WcaK-like protein